MGFEDLAEFHYCLLEFGYFWVDFLLLFLRVVIKFTNFVLFLLMDTYVVKG